MSSIVICEVSIHLSRTKIAIDGKNYIGMFSGTSLELPGSFSISPCKEFNSVCCICTGSGICRWLISPTLL